MGVLKGRDEKVESNNKGEEEKGKQNAKQEGRGDKIEM